MQAYSFNCYHKGSIVYFDHLNRKTGITALCELQGVFFMQILSWIKMIGSFIWRILLQPDKLIYLLKNLGKEGQRPMKQKYKTKGKRALAVLLSIMTLIHILPATAFALTTKEGEECSSTFGSAFVGADGEYYYSADNYPFIAYDKEGNITLHTGGSRDVRYRYLLTDDSGESHHVYCIEAGIRYSESDNGYISQNGENSNYFNNLPMTAKYGIMLTSIYGWQPGKSSPVSGTNEDDYAVATQIILWEYQQQLRTGPAKIGENNYGIPADNFFQTIQGRPAEKCYNWILEQSKRHNTIPSFCANKASESEVYKLKYNQDSGKYSLTITDTNNTLADLKFTGSDDIKVKRDGNKYTFTSDKMLTDTVTLMGAKKFSFKGEKMLIWGRPEYQTMMSGVSDPVVFYVKINTETYGTGSIVKISEDGKVNGISFHIKGGNVDKIVTTNKNGSVDIKLLPGVYTITEQTANKYVPQSVQKITIVSGHTSTVTFNNVLKRGSLKVIKTSEDKFVEGMKFHLYGTSLAGTAVNEYGKYRIYSFFLQGHTTKEKEDFLKNEYGTSGRSDIIIGTGIGEAHDAKGIKLHRGYGDNAPEILLKWNQVVKRIEKLIAVDRYMSKKELEYLPEYEKDVLAAEIYYFYYNQPEEIVRPYPYGADYYAGVRAVRPQLDELEHVNEILAVMDEVFENTADFARNYAFMQKAYKDLTDYRNGVYSLFSPLPAKTENIQTQTMPKPTEIQSREEILAERLNVFYQEYDIYDYQINVEAGQTQEEVKIKIREQLLDPQYVGTIYDFLASVSMEMEPEDEQYAELQELLKEVASLPSMNPPYDLKVDTIVYIGTAEYEIQFLSDEMVVLHDLTYPLFTKEMSRQEFDRKLRENPANDHLHSKQSLLETQAEKKKEESPSELSEKEGIPIENQSEYPIFRKESMKSVQDLLKEEQPSTENEAPTKIVSEELAPAWEKTKSPHGVQTYDLHPEIPQHQRNQYCITNDKLGYGTQKEKFRANIMAIQLLKKCEEENRFATPDEQEILAKYVGWGGLSDAFDETKSAWSYEYLELKTVLTPEEYDAARQSTLTAFYTPPVVVKAIYQVLENMGLKSGNILEPSCAVGNFIGMKPESLSDCKVYGVEIDSISGRIAGQLYQKSAIAVQGYEEAELPDSFFDAAVGNVPFGQFKLSDKRYDKYNFLVHDYFFAKTLDKVRPGGVIAFITSSGTMDKKNPSIRKYIAQRAELLGAIRLPNDTFKKNAGTEVNSDILFLQKRDRMIETEPDWLYLDTDENGITQNRYFIDHPEMILGEMVMESTQFGMGSTCRIYADSSLEELLQAAIENIQAEISEYEMDELVEEEDKSIPAEPSVANFSYTVIDGKIYYRENSRMKLVELSVTRANRVRGMVAIRDCVRELIAYQTEGYADRVIEKQQEKLNRLYDAFQKKYGLLNARANSLVFSDDNSYPLLCSLEIVGEDGTLERKADMFSKRTIKPHQAVTKVDTASEALSLSLSERACVDMDYMCSLTGKGAEELEQELRGIIFRLPEVIGAEPHFVSEDEYLSGNVRKKLKEARLAAQSDEIYKSNVEACNDTHTAKQRYFSIYADKRSNL